MELTHLRCFLAVADELHFGHAAMKLEMLPSALGRWIKLLEDELGAQLFVRTTRSVALTREGNELVREARAVLLRIEGIEDTFRRRGRMKPDRRVKIGTIDSAASGLIPQLLHNLKLIHPELTVQVQEDKSNRLLPRILTGSLDMAFVRPPERPDDRLEFIHLLEEAPIVALRSSHPLANAPFLTLADIADQPLIVPDRKVRPHSYDLTMRLFHEAGLTPRIGEIADEKQTIINLVRADLGLAVVPNRTARLAIPGVDFVPLCDVDGRPLEGLPLALVWSKGTRDETKNEILDILGKIIER